jgi:carboxymethylenebutenolidase
MRRIVRFLLAVLLLALVLTLGTLLSIPVDTYLNRNRVAELTNALTDGPTPVRMYIARPEGEGPHPAVVMIHEFWGLNEALISKADLLATEGYLVVAPDTLRGTTTNFLLKALWHTISTPDARVVEDLDAVMGHLAARGDVDAERVVVMGFCYGGGKALAFALARPEVPAGTGVFYGSLSNDSAALARLRGPVLGIFGETDDLIPVAEVRAFEVALATAGTPHRVEVFPGVGHAFVTSAEGIAGEVVQAEAWGIFTEWLAELLQE